MRLKRPKTLAVIGLQWGDEGKGKVTDFLAQQSDVIVRFQGGNNAGHTIVTGGEKFALSHLPVGVFNPKAINVIGQGCVVNPQQLLEEINQLKARWKKPFQLYISDRAHVIMPYHLDLDRASEEKGSQPIGTTGKGIGPAYQDKYARLGIRWADFIVPSYFRQVLARVLPVKNRQLASWKLPIYKPETLTEQSALAVRELAPYVVDAGRLIDRAIGQQKRVLFEGSQGVMLCVENGTYPFVTSSSPTGAGVALGAGVDFHALERVLGVVKAYSTRVGAGFFPTEINGTIAEQIRQRGHEFGTVTKRPRRIGWLDAVMLRHSVRVAGVTELALTLLDVLDGLDEIQIATAYQLGEQTIDYVPASIFEYQKVKPVYQTLSGWKTSLTNMTTRKQLPSQLLNYVNRISQLVGVPVKYLSVGPDRHQTIKL